MTTAAETTDSAARMTRGGTQDTGSGMTNEVGGVLCRGTANRKRLRGGRGGGGGRVEVEEDATSALPPRTAGVGEHRSDDVYCRRDGQTR